MLPYKLIFFILLTSFGIFVLFKFLQEFLYFLTLLPENHATVALLFVAGFMIVGYMGGRGQG